MGWPWVNWFWLLAKACLCVSLIWFSCIRCTAAASLIDFSLNWFCLWISSACCCSASLPLLMASSLCSRACCSIRAFCIAAWFSRCALASASRSARSLCSALIFLIACHVSKRGSNDAVPASPSVVPALAAGPDRLCLSSMMSM